MDDCGIVTLGYGSNPTWYGIQFLLCGINRVQRRSVEACVSVERRLARIGRRHAWLLTLGCCVCDTLIKPSHVDRLLLELQLCVRLIVVLTSFGRCYCHHGMCPRPTMPRWPPVISNSDDALIKPFSALPTALSIPSVSFDVWLSVWIVALACVLRHI